MKNVLAVCFVGLVIGGCASTPKTYQDVVSDHRVEENLYEVSAKGSPGMAVERINAFWVFHCAELAKAHGKTYVSLNDAIGREIVKPIVPKVTPGFGSQTGWSGGSLPVSDGVYRPDTKAFTIPAGHTTIIHNYAVAGGNTIFVHNGLARFFDNPPPVEAGVTYRVDVILSELANYVHGAPTLPVPPLQLTLNRARVVTALGRDYAKVQEALRMTATAAKPDDPKLNPGVALIHAEWAFPGEGSWVDVGGGFVAEGGVVKTSGKTITFVAALPADGARFKFERLHSDCGRQIGGIELETAATGKNDISAAQLAALVDADTPMSTLDPVHLALIREACSAAGYSFAS